MTRLSSIKIDCTCGNTFKAAYYSSINTFIDPMQSMGLIRSLINKTLNTFKCDNCGKLHRVSSDIFINCLNGMFTISTDEDTETIKEILTKYEVLDEDGSIVDEFTKRLESFLKQEKKEEKE